MEDQNNHFLVDFEENPSPKHSFLHFSQC